MLRQTPDVNGCVTINWPSKNVPHGGVFHSRKAEPSSETAGFLKVLLEESKLTSELRKKSSWALRDDSVDRWSGGRQDGRGGAAAAAEKAAPHYGHPLRPHTSRRRSLSCIRESGAFDVDIWRPIERGEDRDELKQKLQELMERGDAARKQRRAPPPVLLKKAPTLPTTKDMRQELLSQIRERAEWLAEMEALGHAAPHRDLIHDQIAERMRRLAALRLDTERSQRTQEAGSARSDSERGTPRSRNAGAGTGRDSAPGTANSSLRAGRSVVKNQHHVDSRSKSAAPNPRRERDENVAAYVSQFSPLARSPRRRS